MDTITIQVPATPAIERLVAALLQQDGIAVSRARSTDVKKPRDFVTLAEGAEIAGVNYFTFREWVIDQKLIPHSRPSGAQRGRIKVRVADIDKLLSGKKKKKTPGRKGREVSII